MKTSKTWEAAALALAVLLAGCTSAYSLDKEAIQEEYTEVNGTLFGTDCFKDGYTKSYRISCTDSLDNNATVISCSEGEVVSWPDGVEKLCVVEAVDYDVPITQGGS